VKEDQSGPGLQTHSETMIVLAWVGWWRFTFRGGP